MLLRGIGTLQQIDPVENSLTAVSGVHNFRGRQRLQTTPSTPITEDRIRNAGTMSIMKRVASEVSITNLILTNTLIPRASSMISLPEALADTIDSLNGSQQSNLFYDKLLRSYARQMCHPFDDDRHDTGLS